MDKANKNINDFNFILSEAIRYHEGYSAEESHELRQQFLAGEPKMSIFAKISSSDRDVIIGVDANNRFYTIADRILGARKEESKLISRVALVDALKVEFAKIVIEQEKSIDKSAVSRIVDRAVICASKENLSTSHYVPIIFFNDFNDEELLFGPVKFISKDRFVREHLQEEDILACWYADREKLDNYLINSTAIVEIIVPPCDVQFSERRAYVCVKIILSVFKLFLGRFASGLALYDGVMPEWRAFKFSKQEKIKIKLDCNPRGANHDNWRDVLSLEPERLSTLFSLALPHIIDPKPSEVLANRIVDALWWFGEAFDDKDAHSRIVKYTTAIERLLTTSNENVSQQVINRGSKAIAIFEGRREHWKGLIDELYDLRSRIVHGSYSISNSVDEPSDYWAQELARKIIMGMTIVFYRLEWDTVHKNSKLDAFFASLEVYPDKIDDAVAV